MQQLLPFTFLLIGLSIKYISGEAPYYLPSTIRDHILSITSDYNKHDKAPEESILKSVYFFHATTQEPEKYPIRIRFPPPQKKIRVVFIKPPEPLLVPEIVAARPSEEKTLIYVLSKSLEPLGSITVPSSAGAVIKKKPEVYYIRYKDLKHARDLISKSLQGVQGGTMISPVSDENSFIRTLDDTKYSNKLNSTHLSSHSNKSDFSTSYFGHDRKRGGGGIYGLY